MDNSFAWSAKTELRNQEIEFLQQSNFIESEYDSIALDDAIVAWDYLKKQRKLTIANILQTHFLLMKRLNGRIAGKVRTVGVRVGYRICPPFERVPALLDAWLVGYGKVNTEKQIKKAHVEFEGIHPFEDGNGRTGRIIMNFQRIKNKLPILVIHEGEEQFEYYKWFN